MTYFALFYFFLILSHYMSGFFFIFIISPLVISYLAVLYYFYRYTKDDYSIKFIPSILNFLLLGLFLLEIDNIIYFYLQQKNILPYPIYFVLVIFIIILIVCVISFFKYTPFFRDSIFIYCVLQYLSLMH